MPAKTCRAPRCDAKHYAKGWCYRHYFREWSTGDARPDDPIIIRGDNVRRWFSKTQIGPRWACWEWRGGKDRDGYARFKFDGRESRGHTFAYERFIGPVPDGLQLDHLCRNRACVNPDHLEAVTPRINTLRGQSITAINAAKTACHRGHPFDEENTYWHADGSRDCRACRRETQRRRYARKATV